MAIGTLHVILVLLHIVLVSVWFGLSLRLQFQAKALTVSETGAAETIRTGGNRTVQGMSVVIILFYAAAIANFFVGGGFSVYGRVYHTSLLLGLGLVLVQVLLIQPAWGRLAGRAAGAVQARLDGHRHRPPAVGRAARAHVLRPAVER